MNDLKKIFTTLLLIVFAVSLLLCSCDNGNIDTGSNTNTDTVQTNTNTGSGSTNTDKGTNTNTNTNTNTSTNTNTNTNTNTSTNAGGSSQNKDEPTYDTVVEHGLKVEDLLFGLEVFESQNNFGSEGNIKNYGSEVTSIDVSVKANNRICEIFEGGIYRLYGTSINGQILINLKESLTKDVVLILDNLNMTSNSTKAIIFAEKCNSVKIVIPEGTTSTLVDTTANTEKGVIHVKSCDLTMDGTGTLNLTSYAPKGRGIFNTKNLTINGGVYNIETASSHGIQGEQSLTINGGTFNVTSAKSALKTGDFDEDAPEEAVEGKITINSGSFNLVSTTNGISAYGAVEINNGYILINAQGDGIDATKDVEIKGSLTQIEAKNDGIKTDASVTLFFNYYMHKNHLFPFYYFIK